MNSAELIKVLRERTGAGILDCKKALDSNNNDVEKAIEWLREKGIAKSAKKADRIAAEGMTVIAANGNEAIVVEINSETDFVAKNELFINLNKQVAELLLAHKPATVEDALKVKGPQGTVQDLIVEATTRIGEKISLRRFQLVKKASTDSFGIYSHMGGKISVITVLANTTRADVAKDVAMNVAANNPLYVSREQVGADYINEETRIQKEVAKQDPALASKPEKVLEGIIRGKVEKGLKEICLVDQLYVKDPSITVGQLLKNNNTSVVSFVRFAVGEGIQKKADNFVEEVMIQVKKSNG